MKKVFIKASVVSLAITALLFAFDGVCGYLFGTLPLSVPLGGGECTVYGGVGWELTRVSPLTDNPFEGSGAHLEFYPISLIIVFAVLWILSFLLFLIFRKKK